MTPEALIAALHLVDRWGSMLATLRGEVVQLQPGAGRKCRPLGEIPDADPHAERWDAEHALATVADSEGGDLD